MSSRTGRGSTAQKKPVDARESGHAGDAAHSLDRETFGRRLRTARKGFGWTLQQLSALSGVSVPTISRAERGQLALGYENFAALGRALQMDMNAMFAGEGVKTTGLEAPVVTRAGEGMVYRGLSFAYEFLGTTAAGKLMSPVVGTVHARRIDGPEDFARHEGEEFAYVLSGTIEVHFETGEVVRLGRGDSLYFDSRIGHAYVSTSRQLARIVGVTSTESRFMRTARAGEAGAAAAPRKRAAAARRPDGTQRAPARR
ncbi:helix-turn-helix domain-containing protein [Xenophilus sp.]|uniref:helix-turn-helix domain-containing protein n=2 Tax=Xenophilus sp. TaxID=1873499 RepID=UPI0037DC8A08